MAPLCGSAALRLHRIAAAKAGSRSDQRFPRLLYVAKSSSLRPPCQWGFGHIWDVVSRIVQMVIAFPGADLPSRFAKP